MTIIPQIIMISLTIIDLIHEAFMHGKLKKGCRRGYRDSYYNFIETLFAFVAFHGLLIWGGFYEVLL